jgi:hypothetical protein
MERRKPGSSPHPAVLRRLVRSGAIMLGWLAAGRAERAAFKALDGAVVLAEAAGRLLSNDAPVPGTGAGARLVTDEFPVGGGAASLDGAAPVAVEAARRPERPVREAAGGLRARYAEDDGVLRRTGAALWLAVRRPARAGAVAAAVEAAPAALRVLRGGGSFVHGGGRHADRVAELLGERSAGRPAPAEQLAGLAAPARTP